MTALLLCLVSGDCHGPRQLKQQIVYQQQYAYKAVPLYVVADQGGQTARIRQLEDAVLKLTSIAETQQLLLQQQSGLQLNASKYEAQARLILNRSCIGCHSGAEPKGAIDLSGEIGVGLKLLCVEMVAAGEMPPKGKTPLSEADKQTLANWSREDRAAVREFLKGEGLQ